MGLKKFNSWKHEDNQIVDIFIILHARAHEPQKFIFQNKHIQPEK